jgi:hypothetical protein
MKILFAGLLIALIPVSALAQEPVGCDKFKWPLDKERALLTSADVKKVASGADASASSAVELALAPLADARLPMPPERAPKSADTFAGFVRLNRPGQKGIYKINLAGEAWIDVVQDNHYVKSGPFSGALGCEGIRKSVKFELSAAPLLVQLSGVRSDSIRVVITPADD